MIEKIRRLILSEQEQFLSRIGVKGRRLFGRTHIPTVVRLSGHLLKTHSEADKEITLLGAWLHDSGYIWGGSGSYPDKNDHAVTGEIKAREILEGLGADNQTIKKVCHIVRSHRNRDVAPKTIESKIVAAADSGAHFYGKTYETILTYTNGDQKQKAALALEKLERDWQDVSVFPELAKKVEKKYRALKNRLKKLCL